MKSFQNPPLLKKGDKVRIVAPAGKLKQGLLEASIRMLEAWGLIAELGEHLYDGYGYFSASDSNRLNDIQLALDDRHVAAVIMARGGYGTTRILDKIDFRAFLKHPKWIVGFSDITALHLKLNQLQLTSIHGAMGTTLAQDSYAAAMLNDLLFTGRMEPMEGKGFRDGIAEAELIGGNLALLADSMGTPTELNSKDKILFLEDIGEPAYKIDRMMYQLLRGGKLQQLAGLVVGHFSGVKDEVEFGNTWQEIIKSIVNDFNFPVAFNFPVGHEPNNYPVVIGGKYRLEVSGKTADLLFLN